MSLYSDRTFESLQEEMLNDIDDTVSTIEGSLVAISIAKQASRLVEVYEQLDYLNDQILFDTQDDDYLDASGTECGCERDFGDYAVVTAWVNCECEEGDQFTATDADYIYTVTESAGTIVDDDGNTWYVYHMEADDIGILPGNYTGYIEPLDAIDYFSDAKVVENYTPGAEEESTEDYRERRYDWMLNKPFAGNRAYYIKQIGDITGVGAVKTKRRVDGEKIVNVYIVGNDFKPATEALLETVNKAIEPNDGSGDGIIPIGQYITVQSATAVEIKVTADITYDSSVFSGSDDNTADIESACANAIESYIDELAQGWADSSTIYVRCSAIIEAILTADGIIDCSNVSINGATAGTNLQVDQFSIPSFSSFSAGTLTISS